MCYQKEFKNHILLFLFSKEKQYKQAAVGDNLSLTLDTKVHEEVSYNWCDI